MLALLAQIDVPRAGPDLDDRLRLFFVAFAVGFLVAVAGHVLRWRTLQIVGITLVFAATAIFMAATVEHN